jgi:hypothetical protein
MDDFVVTSYGAVGDGKTDDTDAIQHAIDTAAERQGTVQFPAGIYCCRGITLRPHVGLYAHPTWSFKKPGGAIIRLIDPTAKAIIDLTGAYGATIDGLNLDGGWNVGENVHGILVDKPDYGSEEDTPRIERCRIFHCTGDGIHLSRIWCFTVRHCLVINNRGDGLRVRGWDGFLLDNWLTANGKAGYGAYEENSSITMIGNRIEWNQRGGIVVMYGSQYNITGNYIDRSGGPGMKLLGQHLAVTGNVIYRSGKPEWTTGDDPFDSCQVRLEEASGVTFTGNTMAAGRDDGKKGDWSPRFGLVVRMLSHTVVTGNTLFRGARVQPIVDNGAHGEGVIITDNPGSIDARG